MSSGRHIITTLNGCRQLKNRSQKNGGSYSSEVKGNLFLQKIALSIHDSSVVGKNREQYILPCICIGKKGIAEDPTIGGKDKS
jgi:hypothetical protein